MTDSTNSLAGNPQEQLLFLLGGMDAKIDGVVREQSATRVEAAEFRAEVKGEIASVKNELNGVKNDVDVLKSKQSPKTPWYLIAGGLAGIGSIVITAITLVTFMNYVGTL